MFISSKCVCVGEGGASVYQLPSRIFQRSFVPGPLLMPFPGLVLQAEARLAAKRAARAEAREIRMKELERQQKEVTLGHRGVVNMG